MKRCWRDWSARCERNRFNVPGKILHGQPNRYPRSRGILLSATEWREKSRFVAPVDWSIRQKKHSCPLQVSGKTPYNYSQAAARCCLACSLGVGPNDIAEMYAEWNEEGILGRSSAQWLKDTMTKLGLSRKELTYFLGVCEKTVKNWKKSGFPAHGVAARMVREKLERMIEDHGLDR